MSLGRAMRAPKLGMSAALCKRCRTKGKLPRGLRAMRENLPRMPGSVAACGRVSTISSLLGYASNAGPKNSPACSSTSSSRQNIDTPNTSESPRSYRNLGAGGGAGAGAGAGADASSSSSAASPPSAASPAGSASPSPSAAAAVASPSAVGSCSASAPASAGSSGSGAGAGAGAAGSSSGISIICESSYASRSNDSSSASTGTSGVSAISPTSAPADSATSTHVWLRSCVAIMRARANSSSGLVQAGKVASAGCFAAIRCTTGSRSSWSSTFALRTTSGGRMAPRFAS
mmetsp:Transcript_10564/g.34724  ORF Transcript_10564/g.34724 Transcript_10564/m.34724 type:complete len:288 (-) Transcript_10564:352-1215(-)